MVKKLLSSMEILIADTACRARNYIVSKVYRRIKLNMDEQASAGIADQSTSTILNTLLRISIEEEHFVLYDAVVSLLHDLELILSSHRRTYDSEARCYLVLLG